MAKVPHNRKDKRLWRLVLKYKLRYSLAGLRLGAVCIWGGVILCVADITGSTNWVATFFGFHSSLTGASPGTVLFIVGLFIVGITRFNPNTRR